MINIKRSRMICYRQWKKILWNVWISVCLILMQRGVGNLSPDVDSINVVRKERSEGDEMR